MSFATHIQKKPKKLNTMSLDLALKPRQQSKPSIHSSVKSLIQSVASPSQQSTSSSAPPSISWAEEIEAELKSQTPSPAIAAVEMPVFFEDSSLDLIQFGDDIIPEIIKDTKPIVATVNTPCQAVVREIEDDSTTEVIATFAPTRQMASVSVQDPAMIQFEKVDYNTCVIDIIEPPTEKDVTCPAKEHTSHLAVQSLVSSDISLSPNQAKSIINSSLPWFVYKQIDDEEFESGTTLFDQVIPISASVPATYTPFISSHLNTPLTGRRSLSYAVDAIKAQLIAANVLTEDQFEVSAFMFRNPRDARCLTGYGSEVMQFPDTLRLGINVAPVPDHPQAHVITMFEPTWYALLSAYAPETMKNQDDGIFIANAHQLRELHYDFEFLTHIATDVAKIFYASKSDIRSAHIPNRLEFQVTGKIFSYGYSELPLKLGLQKRIDSTISMLLNGFFKVPVGFSISIEADKTVLEQDTFSTIPHASGKFATPLAPVRIFKSFATKRVEFPSGKVLFTFDGDLQFQRTYKNGKTTQNAYSVVLPDFTDDFALSITSELSVMMAEFIYHSTQDLGSKYTCIIYENDFGHRYFDLHFIQNQGSLRSVTVALSSPVFHVPFKYAVENHKLGKYRFFVLNNDARFLSTNYLNELIVIAPPSRLLRRKQLFSCLSSFGNITFIDYEQFLKTHAFSEIANLQGPMDVFQQEKLIGYILQMMNQKWFFLYVGQISESNAQQWYSHLSNVQLSRDLKVFKDAKALYFIPKNIANPRKFVKVTADESVNGADLQIIEQGAEYAKYGSSDPTHKNVLDFLNTSYVKLYPQDLPSEFSTNGFSSLPITSSQTTFESSRIRALHAIFHKAAEFPVVTRLLKDSRNTEPNAAQS